jgi:D-aminopeptidase
MIEKTSAEAVAQASSFEPFVVDGPITVNVVFMSPAHADTLENIDIVTRIDGCTISFEAQDLLKAFEWLNAMAFLSPVVR